MIPYKDGEAGLDMVIWFGEDMDCLFEKSCDTIRKPYHCDKYRNQDVEDAASGFFLMLAIHL